MKDITNNIVSRQILDYYKDIMKIKTDKKYLLTINLSKLISENDSLLIETFFGLTCEIKLFRENLNNT